MNPETENTHLVLAAHGPDRPGLVERLSGRIAESGCNIDESRLAVLGRQCVLVFLLSGPWHALSKLEGQLSALGEQLGLALSYERTGKAERQDVAIPYTVELVTSDRSGIVRSLAAFFARQGINIEALQTSSYPAPHTGSPMLSVVMTVGIPARMHIATLRGDFLDYCDDLNLDATFEPLRG
ncbi:glycine cleavage system protein R [Ferrigenium sp. UT5]|uniref:glycine cleavage system protein R n=1 Tax=Ferrigenium sp. UT5 TaxID=3242105 RepID=UPI00354FC24A